MQIKDYECVRSYNCGFVIFRQMRVRPIQVRQPCKFANYKLG